MQNERAQWGSNFGFLMAAIGSAVGLGNIWGFPYKMGKGGGFAFLLLYLALAVVVGISVMLGELALGRKTGKGVMGTYLYFSNKYAFMGVAGVMSGFFILAFYSVLGGVVTRYMLAYLMQLLGLDGFAGQGGGFFGFLLHDPGAMIFFYGVFMILTAMIVMGGIEKGIEKFAAVATPALFGLLLLVIVYVAAQPGAMEGYAFMFKPSLAAFRDPEIGFFGVLRSAAGQMFFSLSLGMGCMMTYGSYLSKKENLQKNALIIPLADTLMAVMAGMAVMPACAAFGVPYQAGPSLLFESMQTVFTNMGSFGNFMGFLFYFLVFIAALTSSISQLEVTATFAIDRAEAKGKSPDRHKLTAIFACVIFVFGLPVALDAMGKGGGAFPAPYELLGLTLKGPGYNGWNASWMDLYDLFAEGILMPIGALVMSLLIGWVWGTKTVQEECELCGSPFRFYRYFRFCFCFVVPIMMAVVLYAQLLSFFG